MALWIDNTTVALAADDSAYSLHLGSNVYLAYSRSLVLAAMLLGNVAQSTCGREVAYGVARCVRQNIFGYANECVLLAEHLAVLADKCKTVYVWVDNNTEVVLASLHLVHDASEVLLQWLWVVCEVAVRCVVEYSVFYAESLEQSREDNSANAVDSVDTNLELGVLDSLYVGKLKVENALDMTLVHRAVACIRSEVVYISIVEVFLLGYFEHLVAILLSEEFALAVEQLQCVPLAWVVACGDDDATESACPAYSKLCSRSGSEVDVDNIKAHTHKCTANDVAHHVARDACVATYNDLAASLCLSVALHECSISCCKLNDVKRVESVARLSADSTADA